MSYRRQLLPRSGAGERERALRDLYLELLIKILTNTIYGDPPIDRGHTQFDPAVRRAGRDWPAQAHTMVGLARLNNLRDLVQRSME
jgi:O-methyltransferase/8-demethyl-8-(2,3-dimethoxy-alpha-L-rhamnosyl)tetracenomycin-C 4'-O-methyltransferase